jgi:hypothetical protein
MYKYIATSALLITLSGCAGTQYDNFIDAPNAYARSMADDTVDQLTYLYPPATTQFDLQQKTQDAFGNTLITGLRDEGYAVSEFNKQKKSSENSPNAKKLGYIVDQQMSNLYRITIIVEDETLSRAYLEQNNLLYPAGAWVYKEK